LVAAIGIAFWKMNERKDAAIRELYEQVAELSRVQTAAITKMEAALVALKEAITELNPAPKRGRQDSVAAESSVCGAGEYGESAVRSRLKSQGFSHFDEPCVSTAPHNRGVVSGGRGCSRSF